MSVRSKVRPQACVVSLTKADWRALRVPSRPWGALVSPGPPSVSDKSLVGSGVEGSNQFFTVHDIMQ